MKGGGEIIILAIFLVCSLYNTKSMKQTSPDCSNWWFKKIKIKIKTDCTNSLWPTKSPILSTQKKNCSNWCKDDSVLSCWSIFLLVYDLDNIGILYWFEFYF